MNKTAAVIISPNWKDYAEKYLSDCIKSIRKQDWHGKIKIFLTDNETSEESFRYLSQKAPEAELVLNKNNDGFAKGNNDAIKLALAREFDYVILFNMDTVVDEKCVGEMIKTAESDERIGAVQARLMLWQEKEKINTLGNATHFLGFGYGLGYNEKIESWKLKIKSQIAYPSGAAVLFKAEVLKEIGLFDEEFWMYNEDQDLGWRIWLSGHKCVLAPKAVVYHKYEFNRSIKKYYWMDRNRIIAILKNYHILTLILIAPAFIAMEFGLMLFSLKTGWFKEKIKVWRYFLTPAKWLYIWKARKQAQKLRQIKDKDIARIISGKIQHQEINDWKLCFVNPVFNLYWKIVKKIIIW